MNAKKMLARYAQGGMVDESVDVSRARQMLQNLSSPVQHFANGSEVVPAGFRRSLITGELVPIAATVEQLTDIYRGGEAKQANADAAARAIAAAETPVQAGPAVSPPPSNLSEGLQYATGEGGIGADQYYANIRKFIDTQGADLNAAEIRAEMNKYGVSDKDVRDALAGTQYSAGAVHALLNPDIGAKGSPGYGVGGLEGMSANIRARVEEATRQAQQGTLSQGQAAEFFTKHLSPTGGFNEADLIRATGKTSAELLALMKPTILPPTEPLPDLPGEFIAPTAPPPEAPPVALTAGQEGLDPSTAIVGAIPQKERVTIPQLDTEFRASAPRTAIYDRFGRVTGYNYSPAAKLTPATGTNVFNFVPPGITSRPRSLLNIGDVPGVTIDPVTGQMTMPLSASQRFARDRAELDNQFRQLYARAAAADTSLPTQAPATAAAAFRNFAMNDPTMSAQLRMRNIEQTPTVNPTAAMTAARSEFGAAPYAAALTAAFDPFLARNKAALLASKDMQRSYFERYPDLVAEYEKNWSKTMSPEEYAAYHYRTLGQKEGRTPPNLMGSPYTQQFFSKGGEASTEDFIKKQSGGDVSRETASPETRKTRLPSGVQRAVSKAQESRTVVPVPGIGEARQFMSGFIGTQPDYSVMDPNYKALGSAYRTGEQTSVAADVFGALTPFATASALSKASQIPGIAELIAYHGSPHRFKKFDASKIGTGEGAQSYGHGLYFAENPKVAKEYAINLANRDLANQGRLNAHANAKRLATLAGDPKYAADDIRSVLELNPKHEQAGLLKATLEMLESGDYAKPLKTQGSLYTVDIPDEKIAQMLDWDKPLSQQPESVRKAIDEIVLGEELYKGKYASRFLDKRTTGGEAIEILNNALGGPQVTSNYLRNEGIPGIKYLDQVSRNKPLKDIKREFLNELPEDASIDEVVELLGTGTFSPKNEAIIKELAANDWLGFDYPAQSLSTVLSPSARNYDLSPSLMRAINEAQEGGTRNFVLFPGEEQNIKMLDINGEPLEKQDGGEVTTEEFIKKNVSRGTSEDDGERKQNIKLDSVQSLQDFLQSLPKGPPSPQPVEPDNVLPDVALKRKGAKELESYINALNPRAQVFDVPEGYQSSYRSSPFGLKGSGLVGSVPIREPDRINVLNTLTPGQRERVLLHEAEHSMSLRGGDIEGELDSKGRPIIMDNAFRAVALLKGNELPVREFVKNVALNKDKIDAFFGEPSFGSEFKKQSYEELRKRGRELALFEEQLASLSALEQATGKFLTQDKEMRKLLFPNTEMMSIFDALTGPRQTRMDARDLPPHTPINPMSYETGNAISRFIAEKTRKPLLRELPEAKMRVK